MNKYIQAIIESEKPVFFVSPHLDDAIFSCGALIKTLAEHTKVHVINVFTKSYPTLHTLSAKAYLKQCAYTDSQKLFADRVQEDAAVLSSVGVTATNLDFVDALWRQKSVHPILAPLHKLLPELIHVYPTYRFHMNSGKISKHDTQTLSALIARLRALVPTDAIVFAPAAIGNHIDHVLVRRACEAAFPNFIYWTDFPYTTRTGQTASTLIGKGHSFECRTHLDDKLTLMNGYHTQVFAIKEFKAKNIVVEPEQYVIRSSV